MLVDAIVLAGGRSSRLDFHPKAELLVGGLSLLELALNAVKGSRSIVVVGPAPSFALPSNVSCVQDDPPFGGPVSGIAAGLGALAHSATSRTTAPHSIAPRTTAPHTTAPSDGTLVIACDMPGIAHAIPALLHAFAENPHADGVIALDSNDRRQPLATCYRTSVLDRAVAALADAGALAGSPVFRLIDALDLVPVTVPGDSTADVDTWDDARELGARPRALSTANEGIDHEH